MGGTTQDVGGSSLGDKKNGTKANKKVPTGWGLGQGRLLAIGLKNGGYCLVICAPFIIDFSIIAFTEDHWCYDEGRGRGVAVWG